MPRGKRNSGKSVRQAPTQYDKCGEVIENMAKELIAHHHSHLATARIAYLYCNKEKKSQGRVTFATAGKLSPKAKALCEYDFVITIYHPTWVKLSDEEQKIVLDHELCHLMVDDDDESGETKYSIIPHDFEEFGEILQRYGDAGHLKRLVQIASSVKSNEEDFSDEVDLEDE